MRRDTVDHEGVEAVATHEAGGAVGVGSPLRFRRRRLEGLGDGWFFQGLVVDPIADGDLLPVGGDSPAHQELDGLLRRDISAKGDTTVLGVRDLHWRR